MEIETIEQTIAAYDALIAKAVIIVSGPPHYEIISQPNLCRLTVDGEGAWIAWPVTEYDYDDTSIGEREQEFEARLLTMGAEEFIAWQAEQKATYDRERAQRREAKIRDAQKQQLALLAELKAKYGDT